MKKIYKILAIVLLAAVSGISAYFASRSAGMNVTAAPSHVSMYYYDNKDFFPQSVQEFAAVKPLPTPPHIFITNQHILAAHLIAGEFAIAADPKVKTVVLITQNNWEAGSGSVITSELAWKTPLGDMQPDTSLIRSLEAKGMAYADEPVFVNEHGITGIVSYAAHYFPGAKIVPLVIRDGTPDAEIDALAAELAKLDLADTAIVGTIDMSHYLPKPIAEAHDRMTIETIQSFDYAHVDRLDIDTAPTLRLVMKLADLHDEKKFTVNGHTNSADITSQPDLDSTTSYIDGYFSAGMPTSALEQPVHMLFVGDMMFDRGVAVHAAKFGADSIFAGIDRLFLGTDVDIGNLEGTITTEPSIAQKDNSILRFTFDPSFAPLIAKMGFSAVSLANNHALNFGHSGYEETKGYITSAGIAPFGSPLNDESISTKLEVNGRTVCLVGYHDLFTFDPTPALNAIERLRPECSYIVLFAHWGEEYRATATPRQAMLAHEFIDAGADLVIGAHPHVVEPVEIYKDKAIFYSLGNFVFDQDFSFATEHGLAVDVEWSKDKTVFTPVPIAIEKSQVTLAPPGDRDKVLSSAILTVNGFTLWNSQ